MRVGKAAPQPFMLSYGADEDSPFEHIAPVLLRFSSQLKRIKSEILLITSTVQPRVRWSTSLQESIRIKNPFNMEIRTTARSDPAV